MDSPFLQPDENALPPTEVRITELRAEWMSDGRRARVYLGLTPFQSPPFLYVTIQNEQGQEVASVHIVEPMQHRLVFTMHIREKPVGRQYNIAATISYPDLGDVYRESAILEVSDILPE